MFTNQVGCHIKHLSRGIKPKVLGTQRVTEATQETRLEVSDEDWTLEGGIRKLRLQFIYTVQLQVE